MKREGVTQGDAPAALAPDLCGERREGDRLFQELRVPESHPCFEGHFPGMPILPGVVQLSWVLGAARALVDDGSLPCRIEALKFREPLRPGQSLALCVEWIASRRTLRFEARREGRVVSLGRLVLGPAQASRPATEDAEVVVDAALPPVAAFMPHAAPMVFLERWLEHDADRTLCETRVERLAFLREPDGSLPAWVGIEMLAQTLAVHAGVTAHEQRNEPLVGFLLGTRRLTVAVARLSPGVRYEVECRRVWGERGLVCFETALRERGDEAVLVGGRLNAYVPEDVEALLAGAPA